jgi:hypothetical protein
LLPNPHPVLISFSIGRFGAYPGTGRYGNSHQPRRLGCFPDLRKRCPNGQSSARCLFRAPVTTGLPLPAPIHRTRLRPCTVQRAVPHSVRCRRAAYNRSSWKLLRWQRLAAL